MEAPHSHHTRLTQGKNLPVINPNPDTAHTCLFKKGTGISKYLVNPECDCSQGHHTPAKTIKSSRTAGTFHNQLAKVNKGPVGPKYNNGLRDRIYLSTLPIQKTPPKSVESEPTRAGISRDLRDDLKRGNNRVSDPTREWVLLHSFSCTKKKDGGQRPVINLKNLNSFIHAPHFKMEGIHTLKSLLKKDDWLVKIDLKDAYFSVPISQNHRKFLCFQFNKKSYQFNCLPFGLASAPWVFTKTLKPIAALGRELGIRLVVCIDDILLMAETREKARDHASGLIYLLQCLGFTKKLGEDNPRTISTPRILGFYGGHYQYGAEPPNSENKKDSGRVPTTIGGGACDMPRPLKVNWQNECHKPSDPTSSSFLQELTNRPGISPQEGKPGLRNIPGTLS